MIGLIKGTARQARTVSGLPLPIASYKSNSKLPLKELSLSINPTQSGSGAPAPDNIRPITGVSSVKVARTGKNLCEPLTLADSEFFLSVNYRIKRNAMPKARCIISFVDKDPSISMTGINFGFVDSKYNGTPLESSDYRWVIRNGVMQTEMRNIPEDGDESVFLTGLIAYPRNEATWNTIIAKYDIQIELGSTAFAYSAYQGNTYLIQLGNTYYGGKLDIDEDGNVKFRGNWVKHTLDDSSKWETSTGTQDYRYRVDYSDRLKTSSSYDNLLCSVFLAVNSKTTNYIRWTASTSNQLGVKDQQGNLSLQILQDLTTQGEFEIAYKLATPIEIDLTPTQINSLLGSNNIWHDGNGDVEVLKFMDRQLYFGR